MPSFPDGMGRESPWTSTEEAAACIVSEECITAGPVDGLVPREIASMRLLKYHEWYGGYSKARPRSPQLLKTVRSAE